LPRQDFAFSPGQDVSTREAGCRANLRQDVSTGEAGCHPKMRQDVAAHLFTQHKTACLLTLSPLACHEAACSEPVKRRFNAWSGRRGSNPRQPAWKAGTLPTELLPRSCVLWTVTGYAGRVGVRGLEPRTSCSQSRRATNCATPRRMAWLLERYHLALLYRRVTAL
jgi:hypothetical protein